MPVYLFEYLGQRELQVYLSVAEDGSVVEQGNALERSAYRRSQERSGAQRLVIVVGGFVAFVAVVLVIQAMT